MSNSYPLKTTNHFLVFLLILILGATSGCLGGKNPEELFKEAKASMEAGDLKAATVQLKSILQEYPDHIPSRIQLGRLYQEAGNLPGAQKELEYALKNNGSKEEIIPPLLSVYVDLGEHQKAIDLPLEGLSDDSLAVAYSFKARAYRRTDEPEKATQMMKMANQLSSEAPEVKTATAVMTAMDNPAEAESLLRDVVDNNPEYAPAWSQLAHIYRTENKLDSAEKAYDEAIKLNPTNAADFIRRAGLRIENREFDAAQKDLDSAKELISGYYEIDFLQGVIQMSQGKNMDAQTSFQQAYNKQPKFLPNLYYLALNSFMIQQYDTAEDMATAYFDQAPEYLPGRLLLAQTKLKGNDFEAARLLLEDVVNAHPENSQLLASLADAYHGLRMYDKELKLLSKLKILLPDSQFIQVREVTALLQNGEAEKGLKAADELLVKYPDNWQVVRQVATYYSTQKSFDKALAAAEEFSRNNPENTNGYNLLGLTQLQMKQLGEANNSFLKARELSPDNISVLHNLASLSLVSGDSSKAESYYQEALKLDDEHLSTLVKLALLEQKTDPEAFIKHLETAISSHPTELQPRYLLARHYLTHGETEKVLTTLGEQNTRTKESIEISLLLAEYYLGNNQLPEAQDHISRALKLSPNNVDAIFLKSQLLAKQGKSEASQQALDQALELNPNHLISNLANINNMLRAGHYQQAKDESERLLALAPDNPTLLLTKGKAEAGLGESRQAEATLKQAFANAPSKQTLFPYSSAVYKRDQQEGYAILEDWLEENPDDIVSRNFLAGVYLNDKMNDKAVSHYLIVLDKSNDNALALNNMAWLLREKDPKQALEYAEKATSVNPGSPALLDTLAVVLMHNNQNERALRTINEATRKMDINNGDPSFFYHKAQILKALGKSQESRTILSALLDADGSFNEREEAQALIKTL
ncbi:PEP-CTERM system TPR-repeat protein PrsT [Aestuariicella sp. G3-2]|uniref:XrtA/PEP-CTERM system TPR-repeat protein PrsT n=1 Tax=Pseudomaricurvus albidus TaxID=2842452 RepID=UPI001C0E7ED7|nr:XrtA/PEP-CTERM system TPR-repeat protein PrsT [Aestuariicella albida]MBU3070854.1 PEP-CTERM system TPR-repeat protein PrsT [Aestuariicella albida]